MCNEEKVVFESRNKRNIIIDDGHCYRLVAPKGDAVFDRNDNILKAVISAIESFGNAKWSNARCGFRFQDKNYNYICSLGKVIYCAAHGISNPESFLRSIRYMDGNQFNLMTTNLLCSTQSVDLITIDGVKYIRLQCQLSDGAWHCAITDYDPNLLSLLEHLSWHYHKDGKCFVTVENKKKYKLHHIVWVFFGEKNITTESLFPKVREFRKFLKINGLMIDHKRTYKDESKFDNRIQNMQLLSNGLNAKKNNVTAKLHEKSFYLPTPAGELYGNYNTATSALNFLELSESPTMQDIDNLRYFCQNESFPDGVSYTSVTMDSAEAASIIAAHKHETKLYSEVQRSN